MNVGASNAILLEAQAKQYAKSYAALKTAVASDNTDSAKRALLTFLKASAVATANGFDPVRQNSALRKDFQTLKTAIAAGDLKNAKINLATLEKDLQAAQDTGGSSSSSTNVQAVQAAVNSGDLASAQAALRSFATGAALAATGENNQLTAKSKTIKDIRSLQTALQSGNVKKAQASLAAALPSLQSVSSASSPAEDFSSLGGLPPFSSTLTLIQALMGH